jgi:glycosyltransferase involved in cell wall biosynthesis
MKVSIIILTWQRLQGLGATLESLERQTFKDFDVYISNGNMSRQTKVNK